MNELMVKIRTKAYCAKKGFVKLMRNEKGDTNIIAIILILAIVIALAVIFKDKLTDLFNKIWDNTFDNVDKALETT